MLKTPKLGWSDFDLRGVLAREFGKPLGISTDVNAAALAEARWGNGIGLPTLVYVTVGTGIGGGVIYRGQPFVGLSHPEIGHIHVRRHPRICSSPAYAPFMATVWKGWRAVPQSSRAGRSHLPMLLSCMRSGTSRPTISVSCVPNWWARCRPIESSSAAE